MIVKYDDLVPETVIQAASPTTPDVRRCLFRFRLEQVHVAIDAIAASPHWAKPRGDGVPVVNTWRRHHPHRLADWLNAAAASWAPEVTIAAGQWRSWLFVLQHLKATQAFVTVRCELCDREYNPADVRQEPYEWVGGPRAAIGGVRHLCPAGHHLYFITEWIS